MFFLETKLYMWTILTFECVWFAFFFFKYQNTAPATTFSGCNDISDATVSCILSCLMESVTLTVCDQNLTVFES